MAYINFKEEKEVAIDQLYTRRENNEKLINSISSSKTISKLYSPNEKYSYKKHNEIVFGGGHPKWEEEFEEIADLDIVCASFNKCIFSNIKFLRCKFVGCTFIDCDFIGGGALFEDCSFVKKESEDKPNLNIEDNLSCDFINCKIYARFFLSSLEFIIFDNCEIKDTTFDLCDVSSGIIINSNIDKIFITDSNLSGFKLLDTYIKDLEFKDKDKSKLDEKAFFDKIELKKKDRDEYEGVYTIYENIADKFKENNLTNNFGEYYFLCRKVQRNVLKPMPKISSTIGLLSCGYGERPIYAVYFSLGIILIFSILYLLFGIVLNDSIVNFYDLYKISFRELLTVYNESLNLSVGMFAGVGLNEAQPSPASYMLSNIEMLLGVLMMGVGIGALVKKIVR
ncbi:pentapeptide repeat-containing protein [Clostridium tertium]|uniref:Pentapeptide repeats (8 copies) n=1 Tax=Clostridium tertium TaxID=1559 RepID=A0A6N3FCT7_9CLOT